MSALILKPSIHEFNREQLEQYLETVRAKRMSAAIEYFANKNAKISHEADKVQRKFLGQVEMLAKEIEGLERAELKVEARLQNIEMLKQELGLLTEKIVDPNPDEEE